MDDPSGAMDRMNSREEAVRKLLGSKGVSSPTRNSIASPALPSAAQPTFQAQPITKPDAAISLAAFMGGRATGPRLNRHAPQQDAHDPTQFQQRGAGRTDAPHPLFGRGGVALPGMTGKERSLPEPSSRDTWDRTRSVGALADNTTSTSPSPIPRRTEVNITAPASKSLEELRQKRGTSISSGASDASDANTSYSYSSYSQTRTTGPEAVRQTQTSNVNSSSNSNGAYRARDRGSSISSSTTTTTMRPKSPYSPTSPQPPPASLHVYGRRDTLSRSASPNASITSGYSRGKSPEPSKPASRPASRSGTAYNYSPNPSPITTPAVSQEAQPSAPPTAKSASQAALMNDRVSASQSNFQVQPSIKPEGAISLASFMGGRAAGPRLNRHAPQQDAHDPTQFEQPRNMSNSAPHPIFGRGGVAMPGMTTKEVVSEKYRNSEDRRGAKGVAARYEQMSSPTSTNVPATTTTTTTARRERTISTPAWRNSAPVQGDYTKHDYLRRPTSQANLRSTAAAPDAASPTPNPPRPYTPTQQTSSSLNPPWSSPVVTTPSLARPIQPLPKYLPTTSPHIPASKNPSRAFLRPPPEKEPTPSLTRLKGRGFVQNMVQTSSQLQANVNEFGASPPPSERARPRSSSVLDRWQNAVSPSPTSSPAPGPVSPKPMALRKTRTVDVPASFPDSPTSSGGSTKPLAVTKPLKARASLPSIPHTDPPPRPSSRASSSKSDIPAGMPPRDAPGLGSSSTLISYIKPNKTGDDPAPPPARGPEEGRVKGVREQKGSEPSPLKHVRFSGNNR